MLVFIGLLIGLLISPVVSPADATPRIIDYQHKLSFRFKKRLIRRKQTRFLIIHSTESSLESALNTLSQGKTNYLIARNGVIYRILNKKYRANHAGRSMWDGLEDISNYSVGIELEGYHNKPFSQAQYTSLRWLLNVLQRIYKISDKSVLEHYRVAYGLPNRYVKRRHRGRKKDPGIFNFNRRKAGLTDPDPFYDPDVQAGRLQEDPDVRVARLRAKKDRSVEKLVAELSSNRITKTNTAWRIAREDYNAHTTVYQFPNGKLVRGDQIKDWGRIPEGTQVSLNYEASPEKSIVVVREVNRQATAWDIAGKAYRSRDTFYIFPNGHIRNGRQISDWGKIPPGTKVLVGYQEPVRITARKLPIKISQSHYKHRSTIYLLPHGKALAGDQIEDFKRLPKGVIMLVKKLAKR